MEGVGGRTKGGRSTLCDLSLTVIAKVNVKGQRSHRRHLWTLLCLTLNV